MDFIDTFELRFPGLGHEEVAARNPSSFRDTTMPSGAIHVGEPSPVAFVDGSRWAVLCPNPSCAGGERANFETGFFFCCECRNVLWGHDYLVVTLPDEKTREGVESALLARDDWRFRAWQPDESVADLLAQNAANIVPPTLDETA